MSKIFEELVEHYKEAKCELDFNSNFELLVAVILSAQCTDKRVNLVTKKLFDVAPTPEKMLLLSEEELENLIRTCGFFKTKAKHILSACFDIVHKFGGKVPEKFSDLVSLSGVGTKTANVVLSVGFSVPALAVDTHVFRVANRLNMVKAKTPEETYKKLIAIIPKQYWSKLHSAMVFHGRYVCKARKPNCEDCFLKNVCEFYNN